MMSVIREFVSPSLRSVYFVFQVMNSKLEALLSYLQQSRAVIKLLGVVQAYPWTFSFFPAAHFPVFVET
jgi:hypothetical protein